MAFFPQYEAYQLSNAETWERGPMLAVDFAERLIHKCQELARQPFQMGRLRPEFGTDIRSYVFGHYVIFFRYQDSQMEVITIVEGHRDLDRLF